AARDQRHHLVAELVPVRIPADGNNLTGDLEPGQVARSGRGRVEALALAAITLIRISSGPGAGTARFSGCKTSGPPGLLMPMTVICEGTCSMICPCGRLVRGGI